MGKKKISIFDKFQTSKWYPLLLGKYHKTKPEVRLSIYIEEDKSEPVNTSFKAKEAPARCMLFFISTKYDVIDILVIAKF